MVMRVLDLPINVPWKLIAANPDMMDTVFCNKLLPLPWRSSLALSIHEPSSEELPKGVSSQRLTYLKLTCTLTGYQPSKEETDQIAAAFPEQPNERQRAALQRLMAEYFACYGALLNVAVFPGARKIWREVAIDFAALPDGRPGVELPNPLEILGVKLTVEGEPVNRLVDNFPPGGDGRAEVHIHHTLTIAFPAGMIVRKVQAQVAHSSEAGVTMEAFKAGASVGSRWSGHDRNTILSLTIDEEGIDRVVFTAPHHQASLLEFRYVVAAGETSETKGIPLDDFPRILGCRALLNDQADQSTPSDGRGTAQSTVREYHLGGNRAVFLMLARPDATPASEFGNFLHGLRAIEGIQEFLLVVSRPPQMDGLCVEAWLEAGNFPENADFAEPAPEYEESYEDFSVSETANSGLFARDVATIEAEYTIGSGCVIDRRPERGPDEGHPGVKMIDERSNEVAKKSLTDYSYAATSDATVSVRGEITGARSPFADDATFDRSYRVFTRSLQPKPVHQQPNTDVERLLIVARELCVCFRIRGGEPEVLPRSARRIPRPDRAIVDEPFIRMNGALLGGDASAGMREPAMNAFLRQVERTLTNSWRLPSRYPLGQVGFLDSEFFKDRIQPLVPAEALSRAITSVPDLPKLVRAFGERTTVADILQLNLAQLARKAGVTVEQAGDLRQRLLRIHSGQQRVQAVAGAGEGQRA
jgi:hypothetical protein